MVQDITIDELFSLKEKEDFVLIDVRSPSEYKNATIPGSINIPLFDDKERSIVGTNYKQVSIQAAKDRGLEIVSAKLPDFVRQFHKLNGIKVVFCWRGGMRSKTSATVLGLMGIKAFRLQGGYRTYRKWVMEMLDTIEIKPKAYALQGYTGSGKTTILRRLKEEGFPVLDLEGMAGHRGSIFGQIGLKPNNQKTFDALLIENLLPLQSSPYILFEAESKRIGKAILPNSILEKKEQGVQFVIEMPIETRVQHILEEYRPWEHQTECIEAFQKIKRRIHTPISAKIETDLHAGEFESACRLLLTHYYDPLYDYTAKQYPDNQTIEISAQNCDDAMEVICGALKERN